eukprot:CAMPEP_0173447864 /NCGR_PEP_ID=MMETSP1357-20121228/39577_1 /TAXON_ID=77926 /ORGANISM="Hemiselmis rufescens, Strain PCC563" /LENGTH=230 /DNA_ID=CAMNT_0014414289 /DNA_START=61 /DNA_END=750 /DNA_ORIENTATION=+
MIKQLRTKGLRITLVTGARTTTMLKRIPVLPQADALVCESGSCILYPTTGRDGETYWVPDVEWRERLITVVGDQMDPLPPPEQRLGALWDLYRKLLARGLRADALGYTASFRVIPRDEGEREVLEAVRSEIEGGELSCRCNLGHYDFMCSRAGKGNAVEYLQRKWGVSSDECAAVFDDDNDLCMAAKCRWCLIPSITSESVKQGLEENPQWLCSDKCGTGVFASEEVFQS